MIVPKKWPSNYIILILLVLVSHLYFFSFHSVEACTQHFAWCVSCSRFCVWTKLTIANCDAGMWEWNPWNLLQPRPIELAGLVLSDRECVYCFNSKKHKSNQWVCAVCQPFRQVWTAQPSPLQGPSLIFRHKLCQEWREALASSFLWNAAGSDLSKPVQCLGTVKKLFAWSPQFAGSPQVTLKTCCVSDTAQNSKFCV